MKTSFFLLTTALMLFIRCGNNSSGNTSEQRVEENHSDIVPQQDSAYAEPIKTPAFLKSYAGSIDGKYDIEMVLTSWGDGYMTGRYFYKNAGKPIELAGESTDGERYRLVESTGGKETGVFSFDLKDLTTIKGTWQSADGKRSLSFDVREFITENKLDWAGEWHLNEIWDSGLLLIGNVRQDSFDFALMVVRSSHTGTLEGQAEIKRNIAEYKLKDFEDEPCHLRFEHKGTHVEILQKSSNLACGFGVRATATGKYHRELIEKKAALKVGTGDDDVFPSQTLHDAFKRFVGDNMYDLFAFNMQVKEKSVSEPQDGLDAWVVEGFVQGLFSSNEAIILYDKNGNFWAATIDFDTLNNEPLVRYFTNAKKFQRQLPLTIENWREGFKDYRVIYQRES